MGVTMGLKMGTTYKIKFGNMVFSLVCDSADTGKYAEEKARELYNKLGADNWGYVKDFLSKLQKIPRVTKENVDNLYKNVLKG